MRQLPTPGDSCSLTGFGWDDWRSSRAELRPGPEVCGERRTLKGRCAGRLPEKAERRAADRAVQAGAHDLFVWALRAKPKRAARPRNC